MNCEHLFHDGAIFFHRLFADSLYRQSNQSHDKWTHNELTFDEVFATPVHTDLSFSSSLRMAWSHRSPLSLSFTLWWSKKKKKKLVNWFFIVWCAKYNPEKLLGTVPRGTFTALVSPKRGHGCSEDRRMTYAGSFLLAHNLPLFLPLLAHCTYTTTCWSV